MDPRATLLQCEASIRAKEWAVAVQALSDYYQWRLKGGHEPVMSRGPGDKAADFLAMWLADSLVWGDL